MKRKQSTEPDLYVINKKPTKKELTKISAIIKEYKREKQESKGTIKKKPNKTGKNKRLTPEPAEIDLYVSPKKMTAKERKELGAFIENYRQRSKSKGKIKEELR